MFCKQPLNVKRIFLFFVILIMMNISTCVMVFSQQRATYRVFFQDKGIQVFSPGTPLYEKVKSELSPNTLLRRRSVATTDTSELLQVSDIPIYQPYLDSLIKTIPDMKIHTKVRWFNYVVIETDTQLVNSLTKLSFVKAVKPTNTKFIEMNINKYAITTLCDNLFYSSSLTQNVMLGSNVFHSMGINGQGVQIGVLDNGFRWRYHSSLQRMNVAREYDFINNDSITGNEPGDKDNQDTHGTPVLSVLGGFTNSELIGVAYGSSFSLAKTEDMKGELRIEEDYFLAGVEWLERNGVDILSASLGYMNFDVPPNYTFDDLDGNTTLCSKAINKAVKLGMTCVVAAGNSGGTEKTISTPGDATLAITVGSYKSDSLNVSSFSSKGPNAKGIIKPELCALGEGVRSAAMASPDSYGNYTGTSFATPLVSGCVALLKCVFPELNVYDIRKLLFSTASNVSSPDSIQGYGLPNVVKAGLEQGIIISPVATFTTTNTQHFVVHTNSKHPITNVVLNLYDKDDSTIVYSAKMQKTSIPYQYLISLPLWLASDSVFNFRVLVTDSIRKRFYPYIGCSKIKFGSDSISCGVQVDKSLTSVYEKDKDTSIPSSIAVNRTWDTYTLPINQIVQTVHDDTYIKVMDMLGNNVLTLTKNNNEIPLSTLHNGVYYISLVRISDNRILHNSRLLLY
jgi:serine protease AprX